MERNIYAQMFFFSRDKEMLRILHTQSVNNDALTHCIASHRTHYMRINGLICSFKKHSYSKINETVSLYVVNYKTDAIYGIETIRMILK